MNMRTTYDHALRGTLRVPGDKSISHRGVLFGSIAKGDTVVRHFLRAQDCLSTMDCFRRLGIDIEEHTDPSTGECIVVVHGKGMRGLKPSGADATIELYTGNSGTTTRLLAGLLAAQPFSFRLLGDAQVNRRPMKRVMLPLTLMGADIRSEAENDCAPLLISGRPLRGIKYLSPVASAQVKSAILLAGLYADSPTRVTEPALSRDHTERFLKAFGATIDVPESAGETTSFYAGVEPCDELFAQEVDVPGDISSAAYFLVAAACIAGSDLRLAQVGLNPTRTGILDVLSDMGVDFVVENVALGLEPAADILIQNSALHGTEISGRTIPTLIDEIPILAVAACFADGVTRIRDAAELRVKESDRIAALAENLKAMGADVTEEPDGLTICGGKPLHDAVIRTHGDHRIAMSFAIAHAIGQSLSGADRFSLTLDDTACVDISYPAFFEDLRFLQGAKKE